MTSVRVDVWLDVACLFRTRSEAKRACEGGKVEVNGGSAKPHREVRPGDEIVLSRPLGRRQRVRVAALADRHLPRAEARKLYEDLTPPPSPEEIELRRLERLSRPVLPAWGRDKRQRRLVRRLKGRP
ncbi:MAG TPA: RNA-binding S4 domain-containing protein [Vicinamibacterales bacterium]|jgi:ribosome-associated heat shock protein Hsp15|nr:RNA-binding S4 domain-containing protein [Vicinamibacterales bacterium]